MSGILISGQRINRAISGATTVAANGFAVVTYAGTSPGANGTVSAVGGGSVPIQPVTRYFGPGAAIPLTFTTASYNFDNVSAGSIVTTVFNITWTLLSGVEFINS